MATNWKSAEYLALQHMRQIGFDDAALTAASADHGCDIVSDRAVAQVKFESAIAGEPKIRDLHGAAKRAGKLGVFYSLSGYTDTAIAWAGKAVALFQYSRSGEVTPVNGRARTLAVNDGTGRPLLMGDAAAASSPGTPTSGFAKFVVALMIGLPAAIGLWVWSEQEEQQFEEDVSDIRGEIDISRAKYEEADKVWPFKFDEGTLQCRGEQQVVTAVFDGVVYGLEGVQEYQLEELGWYSSRDILLADKGGFPGTKASIDDVLHEGRSACAQDTD